MSSQINTIYTWKTDTYQVHLREDVEEVLLELTDSTGLSRGVTKCISDFPLNVFKQEKAKSLLKEVYPRVSILDGETVCVRFMARLKGGMLDPDDKDRAKSLGIQTETNENLSAKLRHYISPYGNIETSIVAYLFPRESQLIMSRKISISTTTQESFSCFFQGLLALLGYDKTRFSGTLNDNAIASAMLGNPDPLATQELIAAFNRGETIELYISLDLEKTHAVLTQSTGHKIANSGCTIL